MIIEGQYAPCPSCNLNGILWVLRTGASWRNLPERYGPWQMVASCFYRWPKAGRRDELLAAVLRIADLQGEVNWEVQYVDGTTVRAHQHAAGAKGGTQQAKPQDAVEAGLALRSI